MELKRFFLVGNKILNREDKIDTFGDVFQWWVDKPINGSNHGRRFTNFKESDVKKTSDNILDLVEVGDLIEVKSNYVSDSTYFIKVYLGVDGGFYNDQKAYYQHNEILAIYKRQSNGDYKRYEIGGKE